jgi:hypothetical protein
MRVWFEPSSSRYARLISSCSACARRASYAVGQMVDGSCLIVPMSSVEHVSLVVVIQARRRGRWQMLRCTGHLVCR